MPSSPAKAAIKYAHVVSFRLDDGQAVLAETLKSACDPPTWAEAFRFLLSQPETLELIAERVKGER